MDIIAIVGSREWPRPQRIIDFVNALPASTVVVTGAWWALSHKDVIVRPTRGTDVIAATAARARGLQVILVPADFDKFGQSAGPRRNPVIIEIASRVAAFWDQHSRGTKNAIDHAQRLGKPIEIIKP
jgi:hypothetical protein